MKSNVSYLRSLIREMLNETPYVDSLPTLVKHSEDPENLPAIKKRARQLDKFHNTKLFRAKAENAFKHFPFDIYVMPIDLASGGYEDALDTLGGHTYVSDMYSKRAAIVDPQTGLNALKKLNDPALDINKISSILQSGGIIILSKISEINNKEVLPNPWMIVHALYDSDISLFNSATEELDSLIFNKLSLSIDDIIPYMTMKSARNNSIETESDVCAELLTQETITSQGVNFKPCPYPALDNKLNEIKHFIKNLNLKKQFADIINQKGNFVIVETTPYL